MINAANSDKAAAVQRIPRAIRESTASVEGVAAGGAISASGARTTDATASDAAISARGSRSRSRRLSIIGPIA